MTEDQATILILGVYGIILAVFLLSALLCLIANWRLFKRAGYKGWYSLIPFYAGFVKHKITFGEDNKWFYFIGWVIAIYYYYVHFCYVKLNIINRRFPLQSSQCYQRNMTHALQHHAM